MAKKKQDVKSVQKMTANQGRKIRKAIGGSKSKRPNKPSSK